MEFKGTKGEWYVGKDCNVFSKLVEERVKNHKDEFVRNSTDGEIVQCWTDLYDNTIIPDEEGNANAQLIASAPKMLEMLGLELELLKQVAKQLDALGGFLESDVIDRIEELNQLIKEATKID